MTERPDPVPDTAPLVIPSDETLPPGARPFTDFGQFGYDSIDLRVLDQDVYWVDIAGTPHFLVDLTPQYRRNIISHLLDGAGAWWLQRLVCALAETDLLVRTDAPASEIAAITAAAKQLESLGPEAWMEQTVLMRRLREQEHD
jgi:hypothetical protein